MKFEVVLEPIAIQDIQEATDYYDSMQVGLGKKFQDSIDNKLLSLQINPFYQIRYQNVRCLPLSKFPYTLHFTIHEKQSLVIIRAVFHQQENPDGWKQPVVFKASHYSH
jgi:hypothetical protein